MAKEKARNHKESEARAAFAGYTQSVAFQMSLSRGMIEMLWAVRDFGGKAFHSDGGEHIFTGRNSRHFITYGSALSRRGLVYHVPFPQRSTQADIDSGRYGWHLSEAGVAVCQLLVIAGLIAPQQAADTVVAA